MTLLDDSLKLYSPQLHFVIEDIFYEIFHVQMRMFQNAKKSQQGDAQVRVCFELMVNEVVYKCVAS